MTKFEYKDFGCNGTCRSQTINMDLPCLVIFLDAHLGKSNVNLWVIWASWLLFGSPKSPSWSTLAF